MKKTIIPFFLVYAFTILLVACKHEIPEVIDLGNGGGNGDPDTIILNNDPCDPDSVYFANTILPLLTSSCAQPECHDAVNPEDGVRLDGYNFIMQQVTPGNLGQSDLWEAITENNPDDIMPPTGETPLTAEQMGWIQTWILQGALNNVCEEECDPTQYSFATNIMPVVELTCMGCHGTNNPSGGLSLTNHAQVSAIALDGRLMHSLNATGGYGIMPDNTTGLPDCNIAQFQLWVDNGAPNN